MTHENKERKKMNMPQQHNGEQASVPAMLVELMIANGRIEEKLNRVPELETEVRELKAQVSRLKELVTVLNATRPEKTKFVNIVTAIAASVAIVLGFANLSIIQQNRTQQAVQLELLQKNQDALIQKVQP